MKKNKCSSEQKSCCASVNKIKDQENEKDCFNYENDYVVGYISTAAGEIPKVATTLKFKDNVGTIKCRFGIYRMKYKIRPGMYCVGTPTEDSAVLVTANYKMSFDMLRKELSGINAWILVLDTRGVNVWCAAGKGTFGTNELVERIKIARLSIIVSHKTIILPQLAAPGVASHEVKRLSGYNVIFGPIRAEDVPSFLMQGLKATEEMRRVKFTFWDRLVLIPMEFILSLRITAIVLIAYGLLVLLGVIPKSAFGLIPYAGSILTGCIIVPMFLPLIPGKAFAVKGFIAGVFWLGLFLIINILRNHQFSVFNIVTYLMILPSITAFVSMNFTGAATYTSLSGVMKEIKIFYPLTIGLIVFGLIALIFQRVF